MRTQKNISAIAYHRPEVFKLITNALRKAGNIGPCFWIPHKGEGGDKPHIHLVLIGGFRTYDTAKLSSLWPPDIQGDVAASVTSLWRVTKNLNDWLLYAVHDAKYLALKGLEREHAYDWADVQCTEGDDDTLRQLIAEAEDSKVTMGDKTTCRLIACARRGMTWREIVLSGLVPMGQLSQASKAWHIIAQEYGVLHRDDTEGGADGIGL